MVVETTISHSKSTVESKRYFKNGKVAVIYSPGFGAGWSTWNHGYNEELIFDPGLADLITNKRSWDQIEAYVKMKWPHIYAGGLEEAVIEWVTPGTEFQITEYDGSESIHFRDNDNDWITA